MQVRLAWPAVALQLIRAVLAIAPKSRIFFSLVRVPLYGAARRCHQTGAGRSASCTATDPSCLRPMHRCLRAARQRRLAIAAIKQRPSCSGPRLANGTLPILGAIDLDPGEAVIDGVAKVEASIGSGEIRNRFVTAGRWTYSAGLRLEKHREPDYRYRLSGQYEKEPFETVLKRE